MLWVDDNDADDDDEEQKEAEDEEEQDSGDHCMVIHAWGLWDGSPTHGCRPEIGLETKIECDGEKVWSLVSNV